MWLIGVQFGVMVLMGTALTAVIVDIGASKYRGEIIDDISTFYKVWLYKESSGSVFGAAVAWLKTGTQSTATLS